MTDAERAEFNSRIETLNATLAELAATHKRAQEEYAASLLDSNELLRVSQDATSSAKLAAQKASLAANFSWHAAEKALKEKPLDAAEICVESAQQSAEAAAHAATAATKASTAVALAVARGKELEAAQLAKVAAEASAAASAASATAAFLAGQASEFVKKARDK